jgi:hypothetical protein
MTVVFLAQASRLVQADDAFDEGLRLLDQGRPQDLQAALTQFNQALRLYREIGSREGEKAGVDLLQPSPAHLSGVRRSRKCL